MGGFVGWLLIGAIAGAIASAVVPDRTPGGRLSALTIGIVGGILGGLVLDLLGVGDDLNWLGSIVVATGGAVAVLTVLRNRNRGGRV